MAHRQRISLRIALMDGYDSIEAASFEVSLGELAPQQQRTLLRNKREQIEEIAAQIESLVASIIPVEAE